MDIEDQKAYDVSSSTTNVNNMITYINGLDANKVVIVLIKEDASINMTTNAYAAL